jgi:hypothetical protein
MFTLELASSRLKTFDADPRYGEPVYTPYNPGYANPAWNGGSMLWVQVNASNFCVEPLHVNASDPNSNFYCPTWAGGQGLTDQRNQSGGRFHNHTCPAPCKPWIQTDDQTVFNQAWINLPVMAVGPGGTITADLSPLDGQTPTAVKYVYTPTVCSFVCLFVCLFVFVLYG